MAAFGPAVISGQGVCTRRSLLGPVVRHRKHCPFRACPGAARHVPCHRSFQRHRKAFDRACFKAKAQAASEIALNGPTGHVEETVLPEPGLLHPSILNSEYDKEIIGLAIPALGSILLDPLLSLVDTGQSLH